MCKIMCNKRRLIAGDKEHKDSECPSFWCQLILSLFGVLFLFTGIIMTGLWPQIFGDVMKHKLELRNNTQTYKYWEKLPVPLQMEIYLFNWTNPEATLQNKTKPVLQQLGPYVFTDKRLKVNQTFNKNSTITYMQLKSWYFEPLASNGSLTDKITTVNVILSVLGEKLKKINRHWVYILANYYLKIKKINQPYVTKTAGEFLFDGYDDPILDVIIKLQAFIPINVPIKKVGWFYGMNMSTAADGLVNMYTGVDDISKVGIIHSVNYNTKLNIFNKDCSYSNGSVGDLWPEHSASQPNISLYVPSLCSAVTLTNTNHAYVNEIEGINFAAGSDVFNNTCNCPPSGCQQLPGVRSLNLCGNNNPLPLFVSFPHFYLADPSYGQMINGMKPNKSLHEFKIILEKDYSIPLSVDAKFQFNVKISPIKEFSILRNVPELYLPTFWFSESFVIPQNMSDQLTIVTNLLPNIVPYVWLMMAVAGSVMLIISTYFWINRKNKSFVLDPVE
ncbi:protein croquemort-like isoform X2 [Adelges cooleyi]|uniref:protein croquemort-like isoform X2 n=1 Tax=Adelges cooleyi TaxID=133065 RepID=UPI0021808DC1|nr:protein croquemort-like isoform X2 [Adelges cooleyi]